MPVLAEVERGREQDQLSTGCEPSRPSPPAAFAAPPRARRRVPGDEGAEAGADQHDGTSRQRGDRRVHLIEHPRDGQREEVRFVEVGEVERQAEAGQPLAEEARALMIAPRTRSRADRRRASADDRPTRRQSIP